MKTVTSLVAALLLVVSISAVSHACSSTDSKCTNGKSYSVSDTILFYNNKIEDRLGSSPGPGNLLVDGSDPGFGGGFVNNLANTGDYVNWVHKFTFLPPVGKDGIFSASLVITLVNYKTNLDDSHSSHYEDDERDKHKDSDKDSDGKKREHEKIKSSDGHDTDEDEKKTFSFDLSCLKNSDSDSSTPAAVWLEGGTKWYDINVKDDHSNGSFDVSFAALYDNDFVVKLRNGSKDFEIESSELHIDYCAAPVPEPATMMLFGFGMLGLAVYGKRRMNR